MKNLRITTIQSSLIWEDAEANLASFSKKMETLAGQTDLIILPEMFTTGFSMNAAPLAEKMDGKSVAWLAEQAQKLDAAITGSLIVEENGQFFNRLVFMRPDGSFDTYNKRHLFTLAGEHEVYSAGDQKRIVEWRGWKICPLICYDLRFPVWSRNTANYDLLIYVANWPERRSHHWRSLLLARAIENQTWTVGVNRAGKDGAGHEYQGDTSIIDFAGNILYQMADEEDVFTASLSKTTLLAYRDRLKFLADRDDFKIV